MSRDCPVICIQHGKDGTKMLMAEVAPGDSPVRHLRLDLLTAAKLAIELTSPQADGAWVRLPITA